MYSFRQALDVTKRLGSGALNHMSVRTGDCPLFSFPPSHFGEDEDEKQKVAIIQDIQRWPYYTSMALMLVCLISMVSQLYFLEIAFVSP